MSRTYRNPKHVYPLSRAEHERKMTARNISFTYRWIKAGEDFEDYVARETANDMSLYDKYHRDRTMEGGRNKAYKYLCKKLVRSNTRMEIRKYFKEEHEDYRVFDDKDGKKFIWSIW